MQLHIYIYIYIYIYIVYQSNDCTENNKRLHGPSVCHFFGRSGSLLLSVVFGAAMFTVPSLLILLVYSVDKDKEKVMLSSVGHEVIWENGDINSFIFGIEWQ